MATQGFRERLRTSPRLQVILIGAFVILALAIGTLIKTGPSESLYQEREIAARIWNRFDDFGQRRRSYGNQLALATAQINRAPDGELKSAAYAYRALVYFHQRRNDLAIRDLESATSFKDLSPANLEQRLLFLGGVRQAVGDFDGAERDLNRALALHAGEDWIVLYSRGWERIGAHKPIQALADFNSIVEGLPKLHARLRAELENDIFHILSPKSEESADLESYFQKIESAAYFGRAAAYRALGDYRDSMADYAAAIRLTPNDPACYAGRARTEFAMGRWADGFRDYWTQLTLRFQPRRAA